MKDHFTKYAEAVPCDPYEMTAGATVAKILNAWFSRHGTPSIIQSDNGTQFTAAMTQTFVKISVDASVLHGSSSSHQWISRTSEQDADSDAQCVQ